MDDVYIFRTWSGAPSHSAISMTTHDEEIVAQMAEDSGRVIWFFGRISTDVVVS